MRACLFCYTRSLNPHPWLLLPPETPNRSNIFFSGVSRHSLFLLACWSLGLIGLSQFLPLFRRLCPPFLLFVPCAPHSLRLILRLRSFVSHSTRFLFPDKSLLSLIPLRFVPFILPLRNPNITTHNFILCHFPYILILSPQTAILYTPLLSIAHSGTCLSRHKLRLQKTAPALPQAAAFRCPHFVAGFLLPAPSLHSLTARASPFGFAKKALLFVPLLFHLPSVGSRLHYLLD